MSSWVATMLHFSSRLLIVALMVSTALVAIIVALLSNDAELHDSAYRCVTPGLRRCLPDLIIRQDPLGRQDEIHVFHADVSLQNAYGSRMYFLKNCESLEDESV